MKALFGKKKEEKKGPVQVQQPNPREADFAKQEKLVSIKKATEESRKSVEDFYTKLTRKENQIKDLLKQNKRDEARRQLGLFKTMKDQIINLENLCTTLERELIKLEVNMQSEKLVEVFKTANDLLKGQDKFRDDLENLVMDLKERDAQDQELKNLMQELVQGNPEETEEIDQLMNQFEQEVVDEKMNSITNVPVKNNIQIQQPQIQIQNPSISISTNVSSNKVEEVDEIDDLFRKAAEMN